MIRRSGFLEIVFKLNGIYPLKIIIMKKTLLFVDDEEINLFVLERRFQDEYNILTANSADEAIEKIQVNKGHIDALITDLKMPDKSGLQVIEESKENLEGVPCFLLTGYDNIPEIKEALEKKTVQRLFKKPFNYNEIQDTLSSML